MATPSPTVTIRRHQQTEMQVILWRHFLHLAEVKLHPIRPRPLKPEMEPRRWRHIRPRVHKLEIIFHLVWAALRQLLPFGRPITEASATHSLRPTCKDRVNMILLHTHLNHTICKVKWKWVYYNSLVRARYSGDLNNKLFLVQMPANSLLFKPWSE